MIHYDHEHAPWRGEHDKPAPPTPTKLHYKIEASKDGEDWRAVGTATNATYDTSFAAGRTDLILEGFQPAKVDAVERPLRERSEQQQEELAESLKEALHKLEGRQREPVVQVGDELDRVKYANDILRESTSTITRKLDDTAAANAALKDANRALREKALRDKAEFERKNNILKGQIGVANDTVSRWEESYRTRIAEKDVELEAANRRAGKLETEAQEGGDYLTNWIARHEQVTARADELKELADERLGEFQDMRQERDFYKDGWDSWEAAHAKLKSGLAQAEKDATVLRANLAYSEGLRLSVEDKLKDAERACDGWEESYEQAWQRQQELELRLQERGAEARGLDALKAQADQADRLRDMERACDGWKSSYDAEWAYRKELEEQQREKVAEMKERIASLQATVRMAERKRAEEVGVWKLAAEGHRGRLSLIATMHGGGLELDCPVCTTRKKPCPTYRIATGQDSSQ